MSSSKLPSTSFENRAKSSATRNPISLRLYKVLGTSYNEPAIREALETLSELYGAPKTNKGKAVDHEEDETGTLDAIEAKVSGSGRLISSGSGTAARARKGLRRDAELKLTQGSQQFLRAFQEVDKMFCKSILMGCASLLDQAGGLRSARHTVSEQQATVNNFLARFTLAQEEAESLQSRDSIIDAQFLRAMHNAEQIIADARLLMTGEDGPTKAGVDIITTASQQIEQGYDKLTRWCSLEFRQFVKDALLEVTPIMREAIKWLRKKPELLSEALSSLSQTRQSTLMNAFMDALTRGGPGGLPRPIEIHAHDPLRYVGDMLAWVHQCIAGEREFLEGLFGLKGDRRMVGSVRKFDDSEEEGWIRELMDKAFEKLRYPLKTRVRQTVRSQESCIASYKVANLLSFYNLTMRRTIGDNAALSDTLNEITDEAYQIFYDTVEAQARSLARTLLPDDQNAQPPVALLDHTQVLREMILVYKSSLMGGESEDELRKGFQSILDLMVDAAVNMCLSVSDARQTQRPGWDNDLFVLNCLTHLLNVIRSFPFAEYKAKELQTDIDARAELLITDHLNNILRDTSLAECVNVCASNTAEPISRIGAMQSQPLSLALRAFAVWLSTPDVVHPSRLVPLLDRRLAENVHHAALHSLVDVYERICAEVRRPENKYEAANTILGAQRPFGNLSALKQILGVEVTSASRQP
ncbi:hypothetical protein EW145_g400 [Phellinidium pouzarii]|uniref:Conserved Oligomeric Golgi complex subunit 6 C-terminal domain-containing protein n=1 Tax=Phellinidium pouzarii TaxID=167371 RepID=A0A4S4LII3_9AGAM|nr:hypothetical protein EW145_g400 [Phellinidium pouzarii]